MSTIKTQDNFILSKSDLLRDYELGCKDRRDFKYGFEYERLLIDKTTNKTVPYYGDKGVFRLLRQIALKDEWTYITDFGQVIGLKKNGTTITLEPGAQFEISLPPQKNVQDIQKEIEKLDRKIAPIAKNLGIRFLNCGISPLSTYSEIPLIPKKRYEVMANSLPGDHHSNMMRETAGIQVSIDYESEDDAMKKLKLAILLSPVMSAMFANSPVYNGNLSGYKSYRALTWLFTDNSRCGLINKKLFDKDTQFSFEDYIDTLLQVPLLFITRGEKLIKVEGNLTFDDFMKRGYNGHVATLEDFKLHANLFFPEARLNKYIEIRNHDCQKGLLKYSIPAIYKGIFHSTYSVNETLEMLKKFSYEDVAFARESVPKQALQATMGGIKIYDIASEVLKIAYNYLYKQPGNDYKFIEPIQNLVNAHQCPADLVIRNWRTKWNSAFNEYIEYECE